MSALSKSRNEREFYIWLGHCLLSSPLLAVDPVLWLVAIWFGGILVVYFSEARERTTNRQAIPQQNSVKNL
jgi:hypothetical protein